MIHPPEKYKFRCIPKRKEKKEGTMASSPSKELIKKIKMAIIIIIITIIIQ